MAAIRVEWDAGYPQLLRIRLLSSVTWSELEAAIGSHNRAGFPDVWGVLVDLSEAESLPDISVLRLAHLMRITPPGARAFAVIGAGSRVRMMIPVLARLCPTTERQFHVANSEAEARTWLLAWLGLAKSAV